LVAEGLSAGASILNATGRETFGLYPLKGKIMNCVKSDVKQIMKSQEIKDLVEILGMDLTKENEVSYKHLLIATDADLDGYHILSLVLTLFVTYRPDLIKNGFIKFLKTPVLIGYKKDKIEQVVFDFDQIEEAKEKHKGLTWSYKKGLSSVDITEWDQLFKDGVEPFIETLEWSDDLLEEFDIWMGSDPQKRKDALEGSLLDLRMT
jgi:DNA gyrase subunit B